MSREFHQLCRARSHSNSGQKCGEDKKGECRWFGDKDIATNRERLAEVARQQVEVGRIDDSIAVKIALRPAAIRLAEVGGQGIEVERVDRVIEGGVAVISLQDLPDRHVS